MGSDVAGRRPVLDVYARLSRAYNGETIQVDDQVEVCLEELAERDADAGEVFKDNSLSAWKPNVVRKDWEALMARLESGASDGVIVYDLTRFSRKIREGERLVELAAKGIRVWSLSGEYDLATADGRRHFREAMVAAAGESDKISERVRRGKLRKARRGKPSGGGRGFGMPGFAPTPEGWEPGDARERVPDERVTAEQEIVRECYRRLLAGETLTSVVADLNRRGVTTVTGGRWTAPTLGRSLRRAALAGVWRRHYTPYPDGEARREYRCRNDVDHQGCGSNHVDARLAEQALADAVKARLADPRRAERIAARMSQARAARAKITAEIALLEERADALAAKTVTWGVERVDKSMAPILKRIEQLRGQLPALDDPEDVGAAAADVARTWDEAAAAQDYETLRAMVRRAFPEVSVRPGIGDSVARFQWDGPALPAAA